MMMVPQTSQQAYAGIAELGAVLNGKKPQAPFAQVYDDGTKKFDLIDPSDAGESRAEQDITNPRSTYGIRALRQLLMACRRDAQHASASRGRLLLHGAQMQQLGMYEAGNQLDLMQL